MSTPTHNNFFSIHKDGSSREIGKREIQIYPSGIPYLQAVGRVAAMREIRVHATHPG